MAQINLACQYFLNHKLRETELRTQVSQLARAGYECIYAHSRSGLLTPYFSDGWWKAVDIILEECIKYNIKFGIWDEDGYPSPLAGDRIVSENPDFAAQYLDTEIFEAKAKEEFYATLNDGNPLLGCYAVYSDGKIGNITSCCGTTVPELNNPHIEYSAYTPVLKMGTPHIRARRGSRRWTIMFTPEYDCKVVAVKISRNTSCHTVDIMNGSAIDRFIELTYEEYYRRYSSHFGSTIVASFMDEPAVFGRFPWTGAFSQRYQEMWNSEITDLMPHLFLDIDSQSNLVRERYRLTQKELVCCNYLAKVRDWCEQHGIQSIGHLSRTENLSYCNGVLWPDELRCCRHLDIPCTDPLGYNIAYRDTASYAVGIKTVSSAAKLFGKEQAGSDALGVVGNEASLRDLRFNTDFQLVMGITYFNIHGLFYSIDGDRKEEAPPSLFYQHSEWELMPHYLKRLKELCCRLSASPSVCRTAMLYPVSHFSCRYWKNNTAGEEKLHLLADDLLTGGCDFDFIDELTLVETGADRLSEKYEYFIVPEISLINRSAAEILENYSGRLLCCGKEPPQYTCGGVWRHAEENYCMDLLSQVPKMEISGSGSRDIFHRICADGTVFLFNRAEKPFMGTFNGVKIELPPRGGELLDNAAAERATVLTTQVIDGVWQLKTEENHVGLQTACVRYSDGSEEYCRILDDRKIVHIPENCSISECGFKFFSSGSIEQVRLVLEESFCRTKYICKINGCEVKEFTAGIERDCRDIRCDITGFLRSGTTPTVNTVTFSFPDGCMNSFEMPRLYGKFTVQFRHTPNEMPYLEASTLEFDAFPGDLRSVGLGTYSGKVVYSRKINWRGGNMLIDCGRVDDAMTVKINGVLQGTVYAYPYTVNCGEIPAGDLVLEITVYNAPANRDRMYGLPAGLFGPVKIMRIE